MNSHPNPLRATLGAHHDQIPFQSRSRLHLLPAPRLPILRKLVQKRVTFASLPKEPRSSRMRDWVRTYSLRRKQVRLQRHLDLYHQRIAVMSSPYIYTPSTPQQYPTQLYQTPYYYTPRSGTPFIPDTTLYPVSPYSNPNSLPASPHNHSSNLPGVNASGGIPFPGTIYDGSYADTWDALHRQRRPSWHGYAPTAPYLEPPYSAPAYNRRHSFGPNTQVPYSPWAPPPQAYYTQGFHINPWLNAEAPRGDFFFDLAMIAFVPLRLYAPGNTAPLGEDEMRQPATYPALTRMRIVCDLIPQWPFDFEYNPLFGASLPPITLLDVLVTVHRTLHQRILPVEWLRLGTAMQTEVSRAYMNRCRAVGSSVDNELAQGIKRVDFLLKKTRMLGIVRGGTVDGYDIMKLIVAER